jgi:hypothetical protein
LSIPRTPPFRHAYRKPTRLTFAVAGTTVAAAALVAAGLATATPGGPGASPAFGPALTAHGDLSLAQVSLDRRASSRAGARGSAARLAGGSPVTATGRAILASGLAALAAPAGSGSSPAHAGNQASSSRPARADAGGHLDGHATPDRGAKHVHRAAPAHKATAGHQAKAAHRTHLAGARHTGPCATSTLHWWICSAEHALEQHGVSRGRLSTGAADIVVQHESGANPHAYNGWDSNAAAGHPSEGIAQVIGPTFHAYALPGHHNIWNPVDNMIAAFRYAISRYGSMNNIPGVVNVRHGGSYVGY